MIVDIYTHIFPDRFLPGVERGSPKLGNIWQAAAHRAKTVRSSICGFRDMDEIGELPADHLPAQSGRSRMPPKARWRRTSPVVANDAMQSCAPGTRTASRALPPRSRCHDVECRHPRGPIAPSRMGARGVQTFTNIAGHPLDEPRFRPFFAAMAGPPICRYGCIRRGTSSMPDYASSRDRALRCGGASAGLMRPRWRWHGSCSTAYTTGILGFKIHYAPPRWRHDSLL